MSFSAHEGHRYMCPPCGVHDDLLFHEDGMCPVCGMALIERPDSTRIGRPDLHVGSGNFLMEGGSRREDRLIHVFYHYPEGFTARSPILIVVPGAGRNAHDYRDEWGGASERHGVLVLAPRYREEEYDFGGYHMGGLMHSMNLAQSVRREAESNRAYLDEDRFTYRVNRDPTQWIFQDFDRLFGRVAEAVGSRRERYDLFGHSAGGQILHRLVLFHPDAHADRILAGNAGFFTLPDTSTGLPFGMRDVPMFEEDLKNALSRRLVVFVGEGDDATETRGTLLRSPTADRQGMHRLERARHFYQTGRALAQRMGAPFAWSLEVVPGVGHDFRAMSAAAAKYLYGENKTD